MTATIPPETLRPADPDASSVPVLSVADTLKVVSEVLVPLVARGVIVRRPPIVSGAERADLDRRAIRRFQDLRARYGPGPLLLRVPGRDVALVLDPHDARVVLGNSPEPFAPATLEKWHALAHFQPDGVLISHGPQRTQRRLWNEAVLQVEQPMHDLADTMLRVVQDEAAALLRRAGEDGELTWDHWMEHWYRIVRRVVLGDGAADDHELTDQLGALRAKANWSYLRPKDRRLREQFLTRLQGHLDRAEPGSLAAFIATQPSDEHDQPVDQVPQWLFAFDPAGMASFRALALLAAHPDTEGRVRDSLQDVDLAAPQDLPLLRACMLESLRLWPTTPAILRDTTMATRWSTGQLPAGTGLLLFAPFFHRDDERVAEADRFAPGLWIDEDAVRSGPFVPFSGGAAVCPGRNLVLLLTSTLLANVLQGHGRFDLRDPDRLDPDRLPSVLDNTSLVFDVAPTGAA